MSFFKSEKTEKAFMDWVAPWNGELGGKHPCDEKAFHHFVFVYHSCHEKIEKKEFEKMAKKHIHTSLKHNRGLVQYYYYRLVAIDSFLNDINL